MQSTRLCVLVLALSLVATGCLSSTYAIPAAELERLASLPPAERSQVRVVQRLSWAEEPPEANDEDADAEAIWYPEDHREGTAHCHGLGSHHHTGGHIVFIHGGGGRSSGGKAQITGSHAGSFNVGGQKNLAFVVVAAAGIVTVGLVATEGARFDGHATLALHHPLHLRHHDGSYQVVRLENLEPHHLHDVRGGVVTERTEALDLGRRLPLDRHGFAWKFELGGLQLRAPDESLVTKPAALMELGYFPVQEFGVLAFVSLGGGNFQGGDVFGTRYGIATELVPVEVGRLHLGGYAWGGLGYDASEGGGLEARAAQYYTVGAGGLMELDVTTRLAVSLRAGADWQRRDDAWSDPAFMTTVGVAVY